MKKPKRPLDSYHLHETLVTLGDLRRVFTDTEQYPDHLKLLLSDAMYLVGDVDLPGLVYQAQLKEHEEKMELYKEFQKSKLREQLAKLEEEDKT